MGKGSLEPNYLRVVLPRTKAVCIESSWTIELLIYLFIIQVCAINVAHNLFLQLNHSILRI